MRQFLQAAALAWCMCLPCHGQSPQQAHLEEILMGAGQSVQAYFDGMFSIACTETLVRQPLDSKLTPAGSPERFVYDYVVLREQAADGRLVSAKAYRNPKVDSGMVPGKPQRSRMPDPSSVYTEPLSFLLPGNQAGFNFSLDGTETLDGRLVLVIKFSPKKYLPPRVTWEGNSFRTQGIQTAGRLLVDAETSQVVQLEAQLPAPFEFRKPAFTRHGIFFTFKTARKLKLERWDMKIRFEAVRFQNPEQNLWLPVQAETLTVIRGASVPAFRTGQSFTEFRRFGAEVKVTVPEP